MAQPVNTRQLELALDEFVSDALAEQGARAGVAEDRLIQQASRHWLEVRGTQRLSVRVPRFRQSSSMATSRVRVTLLSSEWEALEHSASEQGVTLERLIVHVVVLFIADLDSGRLALKVARGDAEEGEASVLSRKFARTFPVSGRAWRRPRESPMLWHRLIPRTPPATPSHSGS